MVVNSAVANALAADTRLVRETNALSPAEEQTQLHVPAGFEVQLFASEPLIPPPLITGKDLIARSLKPGPRFKEILEEIQTEQLENRLTTREEALAYLDSLQLISDE